MKLVYVAGPFTAPTAWEIEQNVRKAEEVAFFVQGLGAMPVTPHANSRFFFGTNTPRFWYEGTMELLKRCDGIIMGQRWKSSKGSVEEYNYAQSVSMPTFRYMIVEDHRRLQLWAQEPSDNRIQRFFDELRS